MRNWMSVVYTIIKVVVAVLAALGGGDAILENTQPM